MKRVAIIMAGGSGERFWPLSRRTKPKQLLDLVSEKTMLAEAIDRLKGIIEIEDIYIITSEVLQQPIRIAIEGLPPQNVIAEPAKRNTAPCLALGAGFIKSHYDYAENDISVAVLTADHLMRPIETFRKNIIESLEYAENNESIVVFGIPPIRPETGYGYIELSNTNQQISKVVSFKEKPDFETATTYLNSGNFLWNSGMFFFRLDTFKNELTKHLAEVGKEIDTIATYYNEATRIPYEGYNPAIKELFEGFPDISIDYGLIEKSKVVYCKRAEFQWDDIGSWDSLERVFENSNNNVLRGDINVFDSEKNIIMDFSKEKKNISLVGVSDFIVVNTDDAILIMPKEKAQDVKKIVEQHKLNERFDLL